MKLYDLNLLCPIEAQRAEMTVDLESGVVDLKSGAVDSKSETTQMEASSSHLTLVLLSCSHDINLT